MYIIKIMPFNENLKCIRTSKKISIDEAYKGLNLSRMTYINYETGLRSPNIKTLLTMVDFFDVSVEKLLYGKEPEINEKLMYRLRKMEDMPRIDLNRILLVLDALIMESDAHHDERVKNG